MLIAIENVLSKDEVAQFRNHLDRATWQDGVITAGTLARNAKHNEQLNENAEPAISLGDHLLRRLGANPKFISVALPNKIYPPKFNRYADGGSYGTHVDGALMPVSGSHIVVRSDISATLFLSEPDEYDGGELEIESQFGAQSVKLGAGDMVVYPSSSLHRVVPVTRGVRVGSFFWVQSMIRDPGARELLFDLDQSVQALTTQLGPHDEQVLRLSGIYHNLIRRWADT